MSYDFEQQPHNQGMSSGAKIAIGCGSAAFLFALLACGGILYFGFVVMDKAQEVVQQVVEEMEKKVEEFAVVFEAQGYQRVKGQVVDVSTDITDPTVYTVQVFKLNADSDASIAVMAQVAEINGRIDGDLTFFGQHLIIHKDAVITGDLHVQMAQMIDNRGTVEGEIFEDENLAKELGPGFDPTDLDPAEVPLETDEKPSPGDVIESTPDEKSEDANAPVEEAGSEESATDQNP